MAQEAGLLATAPGPPAELSPAPNPHKAAPSSQVTPQIGRSGFQVWCVSLPQSERPTRCSSPLLCWRPFASDFGGQTLGECGLDVDTAAEPEVQQLEATGQVRAPLHLSRSPTPTPAGVPASQQAVKSVGHAKLIRATQGTTKRREHAQDSKRNSRLTWNEIGVHRPQRGLWAVRVEVIPVLPPQSSAGVKRPPRRSARRLWLSFQTRFQRPGAVPPPATFLWPPTN